MSNVSKKWQVQVRISHRHKWQAKGTRETRESARAKAKELRGAWGYGNTRVVRKITGGL
jgi:hypothetical protein